MSRVRVAIVQLVRAHQAESVPRSQHTTRQSVHGATLGRSDSSQRSAVDSLRSKTGEHPSQIVRHHSMTPWLYADIDWFVRVTLPDSNPHRSRLSTLVPHAMNVKRCIRTSSPDFTGPRRFCSGYRTLPPSTCGLWGVLPLSSSSDCRCSRVRVNTTRLHG